MSKGNRRERQAEKFYIRAGYKTEITQGHRWGRTDWFGLFDVMAVKPDQPVRFAQVKSNGARGIRSWCSEASRIVPDEHVQLDFLVCHDYEGWRFIEADSTGYEVVVDERELDCKMGEGVKAHLRGEPIEVSA